MDIATDMATFLLEEGTDLHDQAAVIRALSRGGFKTSHINVFIEDAIDRAYEIRQEQAA